MSNKFPITAQILTLNNFDSLNETLNSLSGFNLQIIDLGSNDLNINKMKDSGINYYSKSGSRSAIRNDLAGISQTEWNIALNAGETLDISGSDLFDSTRDGIAYRVLLKQGDIITKPVRLFKKSCLFENPVFEFIPMNNHALLQCVIKSRNQMDHGSLLYEIEKWKKSEPLNLQHYYYESCLRLAKKEYDKFISISENYLFYEKENISTSIIMTKYYQAIVYAIIKKDVGKAMFKINECLLAKPDMAEFWCVAGDIFLSVKKYDWAREYYKSAIKNGSNRRLDDDYPVQVEKYKDYPEAMIRSLPE